MALSCSSLALFAPLLYTHHYPAFTTRLLALKSFGCYVASCISQRNRTGPISAKNRLYWNACNASVPEDGMPCNTSISPSTKVLQTFETLSDLRLYLRLRVPLASVPWDPKVKPGMDEQRNPNIHHLPERAPFVVAVLCSCSTAVLSSNLQSPYSPLNRLFSRFSQDSSRPSTG